MTTDREWMREVARARAQAATLRVSRESFSRFGRELPQATGSLVLRARFRPSDRAPFDASVTVVRDPRLESRQWLWLVDKDRAAS